MKSALKYFALILLLGQCSVGYTQKDTIAVKSIKGITDKMLELISVDVDEEVDWDEYRMLFLPDALKISVNHKAPKGRQVRTRNLETFIRTVGPLYKRDGFEEYSIGLTVNEFNGVANAFQSFYCKNLIGTYEQRGVNNYLLVFADDRWWIASTTFSNATEGSPVPDKLLDEAHRGKN